MITAVDTNILIDIFSANPKFGLLSKEYLHRCLQEGTVYACEIVWIETATVFPDADAFLKAMNILNIEFSSVKHETVVTAASAWRYYRKAGGKRDRVVADFIIGAHAQIQADRLLTRDRGFYRSYFRSLKILDPTN